jgi:hypothetical protein
MMEPEPQRVVIPAKAWRKPVSMARMGTGFRRDDEKKKQQTGQAVFVRNSEARISRPESAEHLA